MGDFKIETRYSDKKQRHYECLVLIYNKKSYFISFLRWVDIDK